MFSLPVSDLDIEQGLSILTNNMQGAMDLLAQEKTVQQVKPSSIYTRGSLPCRLQGHACEGEHKLELFAISLASYLSVS